MNLKPIEMQLIIEDRALSSQTGALNDLINCYGFVLLDILDQKSRPADMHKHYPVKGSVWYKVLVVNIGPAALDVTSRLITGRAYRKGFDRWEVEDSLRLFGNPIRKNVLSNRRTIRVGRDLVRFIWPDRPDIKFREYCEELGVTVHVVDDESDVFYVSPLERNK